MASPLRRIGPRGQTILLALIAVAIGVLVARGALDESAWGWDESMHAQLPAARIALALRAGALGEALDVVGGCAQYPPVWPIVLAFVQLVFGISEHVARCTAIGALVACALGVGLVTREILRSFPAGPLREKLERAPIFAISMCGLSPLLCAYARTLFLEVPAACVGIFTLHAWLVRGREPGRRADLWAGTCLALGLFTKWNYGLLFGAGFVVCALGEVVLGFRARTLRATSSSLALCAVPAALLGLWWFVLPWPLALDVARVHRETFVAFLHGNQDLQPTAAGLKLLYFGATAFSTPRCALLVVVLALVAIACTWRNRGVRITLIVLLAVAIPIELHPFHLDRFLVPALPLLVVLAAIGFCFLKPAGAVLSTTFLVISLFVAMPGRTHDTRWLAQLTGQLDPRNAEYQLRMLEQRQGVLGGSRTPTAGLARSEYDALLDLVAREAGSTTTLGWIGMSSALSPAALHLGLLARGGAADRFRSTNFDELDVAYFGVDPAWSEERLLAWAARFDVIFWTDPVDLKDRSDRRFARAYVDRLLAAGQHEARALGSVAIERGLGPALSVTLFACRRKG